MKKIVIINIFIVNLLNAGEIHKFSLGESSKVVEKDLIEQIQEHITNNKDMIEGKLKDINKQAKEDIEKYRNKYSLPFVTKDETVRTDLSYIVTNKDIAPNIPLGTIVYPLRHIKLPYAIYLINGGDKAELEWLKTQNYNNIKSRVWIVNGNLKQLKDELKVPIFFYNEKIQERFKAKGTPAIIYQDGEEMIFQYYKIKRG